MGNPGSRAQVQQQTGEDVDKSLQGAVRDEAGQSAAYKIQEHQKGLKKKIF